jgi:hypothetical protein
MEDRVEHTVRPLQLAAGQLVNALMVREHANETDRHSGQPHRLDQDGD